MEGESCLRKCSRAESPWDYGMLVYKEVKSMVAMCWDTFGRGGVRGNNLGRQGNQRCEF